MMVKKLLLIVVVIAMAAVTGPAHLVFAAEPPGDEIPEKIIGPIMWAAVVMDTEHNWATARIKKIEECAVETQAVSIVLSASDVNDILYYRFDANTIFNFDCQAIITKVKNFTRDPDPTTGTLWSFDAQIQFIVPDDDAHKDVTECPIASTNDGS